MFPAAAGAPVTHRWGGPFAVPRDWSMSIAFDRASGLARAGGLGARRRRLEHLRPHARGPRARAGSDLTALPWVGHVSRRWEPEPLRAAGARLIPAS